VAAAHGTPLTAQYHESLAQCLLYFARRVRYRAAFSEARRMSLASAKDDRVTDAQDARPDAPTTPRLEARGVSKQFPGVLALDAVDFVLQAGEIHSIMGENGAGKSTLIKVVTGVYSRDGGQVLLDGKPIHPRSVLDAQEAGISTVYQEVNLIPYLSVAENIFLGRQPMRMPGVIDWRTIHDRSAALLAGLDLDLDVSQPLNSYSVAIQQMVAIARAIDIQARVLILDEPTSSLAAHEVAKLFAVMRQLRDEGMGIVFVSHFIDQVYEISDRITVLRNGKLVGAYDAATLPRIELISKMIGKDIAAVEAMTSHHAAVATDVEHKALLKASGLGRAGSIQPFDLEVRTGEIVGLAGLLGSGRTEAVNLLFGVDHPDTGVLAVDGKRVTFRAPRQAINRGLGFCPEDRKTAGIIPNLSVRENIALALQANRGWLRPLSRRQQRQLADKFIRALAIATPDAEKPVGELSGGNQQKVILARWLASNPRLLILDEPTRGIDVGAKAEIEKLMASLCGQGMAIVFISSELEEIARDSHRVVVLRDREVIGELEGEDIDIAAIMHMIADQQGEVPVAADDD
jgi:galactofuranose transport system ATP-binding protein